MRRWRRVVTGASDRGLAVTAVLVGIAEMAAKMDEGFGSVGFTAPFVAGDVGHACGVEMILYPMQMTEASLGASLPAVAKRMPTLS